MKQLLLALTLIAASAIAASAASITGQLTNGDYRESFSRVSVTLWQGEELVAVTRVNPFGYYRFLELEAGEYTVTPMTSANITFEPQDRLVKLDADGDEVVDFLFYHYNPCFVASPCG